jgi:hypothetical protein
MKMWLFSRFLPEGNTWISDISKMNFPAVFLLNRSYICIFEFSRSLRRIN